MPQAASSRDARSPRSLAPRRALQSARPKWLPGCSDTSTLLVAITLRLGWATAHGPCLMDLVGGQFDALTCEVMPALAMPAGSSFTQHQSSHWQTTWTDFAEGPDTTDQLTEPTCMAAAAPSAVASTR